MPRALARREDGKPMRGPGAHGASSTKLAARGLRHAERVPESGERPAKNTSGERPLLPSRGDAGLLDTLLASDASPPPPAHALA